MGSGFPLFPDQASSFAGAVDWLSTSLFLLGAGTIGAILFALLVLGVSYRRGPGNEQASPLVDSRAVVLFSAIVPVLLGLVLFIPSVQIYFEQANPPSDTAEVFVVGRQWRWKFQHGSGEREIDELHVAVNRPVKLSLISEDVVHSFYVPALRVKTDVLPGRYTSIWFTPTKPGKYHMYCAEYCGTEHARMTGWIYVMDATEYLAWQSGGAPQSPADAGRQHFQQFGCAGCHRPEGGGPGPSLVGLFGREERLADGSTVTVDAGYLRESILDPNAKVVQGFSPAMPSFRGRVNEEQLLQLIAYIQSQGSGAGAPGAAPGTQPPGAPAKPGGPAGPGAPAKPGLTEPQVPQRTPGPGIVPGVAATAAAGGGPVIVPPAQATATAQAPRPPAPPPAAATPPPAPPAPAPTGAPQ